MIEEKDVSYEYDGNEVLFECPICKIKKVLTVPIIIVNSRKQLTTISVPRGLICQHNFQVFLDKNFEIRGYQKVDFEFSRADFHDRGINSIYGKLISREKIEEDNTNSDYLLILQNIIHLLKNHVDGEKITGGALFTLEGRALFSTLSSKELHSLIREFKARNEKNLLQVEKCFLILANQQKIFSQFIKIGDQALVVMLIFSEVVPLGMAELFSKVLINKIQNKNNSSCKSNER